MLRKRVSIFVALDSKDAVKQAFEVLKEGGCVGMEQEETFWSKYFGTVDDRFGVSRMLSIEG